MHSLNLLAHMSPRALLLLLPLVWAQEAAAPREALRLASGSPAFLVLLLLNCAAAALVNVSNFLVTRATSALTLQVLGKAKSIIAVGASLLLFQNPVSILGMAGYGICLLGVFAYSRCDTLSFSVLLARSPCRRRSSKSIKKDAVEPAAAAESRHGADGAADAEVGLLGEGAGDDTKRAD